jgi:DNA-binding MarR family transcriptional regulator
MNVTAKLIMLPDFMIILKCMETGDKTLSDIKRLAKITYKHLHDMKKEFLKRGWIVEEQIGRRKKLLKLTEKGDDICAGITYLIDELGIKNMLDYKRRQKAHKTPGIDDEVKENEDTTELSGSEVTQEGGEQNGQ